MQTTKVKMPEQEAEERARNFKEVNFGYTEEDALEEANRCLQCPVPQCEKGCPVHVPIKAFIALIREKNYEGAIRKIKETNYLPGICGRVCPQENQCEKFCVMKYKGEPVAIGNLERFAADHENERSVPDITPNNKKVAVVGSGPAGLTCAAYLAERGYKVTIFEALHKTGGVLVYGIPEFRLPKVIVKAEVDYIQSLGVEIKKDYLIGNILSLQELRDEFDAVFIGTGAGVPRFMKIKGEDLIGVYSANEFLTRVNLMKAYKFPEYDTPVKMGKKVIVVGGGNVAMDSARVALRLGGEVTIMYRRSEKELPARAEEVKHAKEEGIRFLTLANPVEIIGERKVEAVKFQRMELGECDASGRCRPIPIPGSEETMECDEIIMAIGQSPNPILQRTSKELNFGKWGEIIVDENCRTNIEGIYAGGDIISGGATVIRAMGEGQTAAKAIEKYLRG